MTFKDKINLLVNRQGINYISHRYGVSYITVKRWMKGDSEPHPAMIPGMKLDEALNKFSVYRDKMHLLTIRNRQDANIIVHAIGVRFKDYVITGSTIDGDTAIYAKYNNDKVQLTPSQLEANSEFIRMFAQGYYDGLVYGKQEGLIQAKASIQTMLELANPHHPIHDNKES